MSLIHWFKLRMWVLEVSKFMLILVLLGMAISFNIQFAHQATETRKIAEATNSLVKNQGAILDAIKQVTVDNKLTSKQQTDIIICMLQVPVIQRTTDLQNQCRKTVETPSQPSSTTAPKTNTQQQNVPSTLQNTSQSPNPTGSSGQGQGAEKAKSKPNCTVDILFIHAGKCQ